MNFILRRWKEDYSRGDGTWMDDYYSKIPLCYRCCLRKLAVVPVALHLVRINRFQFRFHDDNFSENVPNVKEAKNRQIS